MSESTGIPVISPDTAGCEECRARAALQNAAAQSASQPGQVDRRQFMTQSALAAVSAVLLSGCAGGSSLAGPGAPGGSTSLSIQVATFPALASVGGIARVDSGRGTPVAAVRTSATTFAAFSLICPHFGCTVGIAGSSFACPCHGARFASNGNWIGGQPTGNLSPLTATYDATAGTLTITG